MEKKRNGEKQKKNKWKDETQNFAGNVDWYQEAQTISG